MTTLPMATDGPDILNGTADSDTIDGLGGDDTLNGLGGDDTLYGGDGNDVLDGGPGTNSLYGGAGDDVLLLGSLDFNVPSFAVSAYSGGDGVDTLALAPATGPLTFYDVWLANLSSIERVTFAGAVNQISALSIAASQIGPGLSPEAEIVGSPGIDSVTIFYSNESNITTPDFKFIGFDAPTIENLLTDGIDLIATDSISHVMNARDNLNVLQAMSGGAAFDILNGSNGNEYLIATQGGDTLLGNGGEDALVFSQTLDYDFNAGKPYFADDPTIFYGGIADGGTDIDYLVIDGVIALQGVTVRNVEGLLLRPSSLTNFDGSSISHAASLTVDTTILGERPSLLVRGSGQVIFNLSGSAFDGSALRFGPSTSVDFRINGSGDDDRIIGTHASDRISGGTGADYLEGGDGDDTYIVDNIGDVIKENWNGGLGGTDTILSSVSIVLPKDVENVTLTGADNINATGTQISHGVLTGNVGNNVLTGGALWDTVYGGDGNDQLYGRGGADGLYGGNGNDLLDGGIGADYMEGGTGDDIYYVDNPGDKVVEFWDNGNGGFDTVYSSISYLAPANVEAIRLLGSESLSATARYNESSLLVGNDGMNELTGGDLADVIYGRAGDDRLIGGKGGDTLTGGTGRDMFNFSTLSNGPQGDTITDFVSGTDRLAFERGTFTTLGGQWSTVFDPAMFAIGTAATTSGQHLIYDTATGALYYDADGAGGAAQVQLATLTGHPTLAASDIVLI